MCTHNESAPMVSIIMPAYNAAPYIESAIRSVMSQTYLHWELLVLDDGSTDETARLVQALVAEDARVRYLPNLSNIGVAKTRNRGMDLAKGQYIAFLDSDDIWLPNKLEKQLTQLQHMHADMICSSYSIIDAVGNRIKRDYLVPEKIMLKLLLKENVIGCSTVLFSRAVLEHYRFKETYFHEDYTLWLDLLLNGYTIVGCTEVLAHWRYIANSRSFNKANGAKKRWRIYREYLHLPLLSTVYYFTCYALAGLRKYR